MADQRLSTDDREMKRTVSAYETENTVNERVAAQVIQLSKSNAAAQVISAVRIATRSVQRTLPRDFEGQQRTVTAEHPPPRGKHAPGIHGIAALSGDGIERVRLVTGCCPATLRCKWRTTCKRLPRHSESNHGQSFGGIGSLTGS
jgi:hypothetical protein